MWTPGIEKILGSLQAYRGDGACSLGDLGADNVWIEPGQFDDRLVDEKSPNEIAP
jgi:hypothetical protein